MSHSAHTRRSVLRAGAWAAPAIVVASAAPAMAASGQTITTAVAPTSDDAPTPGVIPVTITYTNPNALTTATASTNVTIAFNQFNGSNTQFNPPTLPQNVSAGWTVVGAFGANQARTFQFQRAAGLTGGTTTVLSFTVQELFPAAGVTGSIGVATTATGSTITNGNGTFT